MHDSRAITREYHALHCLAEHRSYPQHLQVRQAAEDHCLGGSILMEVELTTRSFFALGLATIAFHPEEWRALEVLGAPLAFLDTGFSVGVVVCFPAKHKVSLYS